MSLRETGRLLSEIVSIPPMPYASSSIEHDSNDVLGRYVPDRVSMDTLRRFFGSDKVMSIMGPYGSGKSTFGVLLNCLLSPSKGTAWKESHGKVYAASADVAAMTKEFRKTNGVSVSGMVLCSVTARQEPISVTILRAAEKGAESFFGSRYSKRHFAEAPTLRRLSRAAKRGVVPDASAVLGIITGMAAANPVLLMIDEFGKNVEYFADGGADGDLFLLQEIAEATHKLRLHVITIQHMSFGEYAAGQDSRRIKEWTKIQGRFSDVHFSNSLDHVRAVLASALKHSGGSVREWSNRQFLAATRAGIGMDEKLAGSYYPLHPFAVDVLPELCARYGQNERTLVSFVSGTGPYTVARFVEDTRWHEGKMLPHMGLDTLYDYFISGHTHGLPGGAAASRLVEIDTIIRDVRGLDDTTIKTLKSIGVLNLVGSSGRLRASMEIIRCAVGAGADESVKILTDKSIITYRHHADEYRVWHGTDIDIMAKFQLWRNSLSKRSYGSIMNQALEPQPVVAARHGISTGTMRLFQCRFDEKNYVEADDSYDGMIIYGTSNTHAPDLNKPVVISMGRNIAKLEDSASDVLALRGVMKDRDIQDDPVARAEVAERLAAAEMTLGRDFETSYDADAGWFCVKDGVETAIHGPAGTAASHACNDAYSCSPSFRNEMINRNKPTPQGAMARNRIMDAIINRQDKPLLGIEGWSAERAIYEAVILAHGMHDGKLSDPDGTLRHAWDEAIRMAKGSRSGIQLEDVYEVWKMPPYGIKNGVMPILAVLLITVKYDNVAVYEHGTFVHRFSASVAERLAKNPAHFRLKWFHNSRQRQALMEKTATVLGSAPGLLGIVGHLVGVAKILDRYSRNTKSVDEKAQAVRAVMLEATEPDEMLLTSLPEALDMKPFGTKVDETDMEKFAVRLAKSVNDLQGALVNTLDGLGRLLLEKTHAKSREELSAMAAKLLPDVSDQRSKVFTGSLAAEIPDDHEWIKYVALTLTDTTPSEWNDEHVKMFRNRLEEQAAGFNRLAALKFSKIASELRDPVLVTVTRPDGSEKRVILSESDKIVSEVDQLEFL